MSVGLPLTPETNLPDGSKVAEQWAQTRLAHEVVMLQDAQKVLKLNRQTIASHPGQLGLASSSSAEDDSDMIHIGDVIQNPAPIQPTATQPSLGSSLLKIGLGAALAGTGVGLPIAIGTALSGGTEVVNQISQPAAEPSGPTLNINGKAYELSLEP